MTAVLISDDGEQQFTRSNLSKTYQESWLQELLLRQPDLVPLDRIDVGAGRFIPICREFPLPKPGGSVFLDLLGISATGRPVLVECKLWRNPQARREVVAQILEYASLLRSWSYSDLTIRLKSKMGWTGSNPLFDLVRDAGGTLDEVSFTDAVSRNLRTGDFNLVIAGDGIREDLASIADHIGWQGARFALVEFQQWEAADGSRLITPMVPFRTEVVRHRLLVDSHGAAIRAEAEETDTLAETGIEQAIDEAKAATVKANRAFWQSFIDRVSYDHPDQPRPTHGGDNWVRVAMPAPAQWLTTYRYKGRAGMSLRAAADSDVMERLVADATAIQTEFGTEPLRFHVQNDTSRPAVAVDQPDTSRDQLEWLLDASNRMVNVLRPRLAAMNS